LRKKSPKEGILSRKAKRKTWARFRLQIWENRSALSPRVNF